ncbi:nuclear transport factor 2 family protein [Phenylobacterium sp.]|jgi:ketosteroid isomerase-like protein|uniref:nuclear transport factor 2 family protein n=1 Tax=Phenylobacterium sp. TaxID=1871053 RepID=UPI002F40748E
MMTDQDAQDFVDRFAAAWAARDASAFLALWHPHGTLHYPFAGRVIAGREIGALNDFTKAQSPHLVWNLVGWTRRGDVIVIEWRTTNRIGDREVAFGGVDKLTLKDGKIIEEVVYTDTAPLQAARRGERFEALIQLPASAAA